MKKIDSSEIDNDLKNFPDNLVKLIKGALDTKNFSKKLSARSSLVKMGRRSILPLLK